MLHTLYFIHFIYYIEAKNDPGFPRWFEIIFHEGMLVFIFVQLLSFYILYIVYISYIIYHIEAKIDPAFRHWFEIIFHEGFLLLYF